MKVTNPIHLPFAVHSRLLMLLSGDNSDDIKFTVKEVQKGYRVICQELRDNGDRLRAELAAALQRVAAAEQDAKRIERETIERCAKVCETFRKIELDNPRQRVISFTETCAATIRALLDAAREGE